MRNKGDFLGKFMNILFITIKLSVFIGWKQCFKVRVKSGH